MTSQNFIYWLQGYLEIADPKTITAKELKMIKAHLQLVFRDEIDPSMGDASHQEALSGLHEGKIDLPQFFNENPHLNPLGNTYPDPNGNITLERC